ncbi:hypothetical protein BKA69DRAFT_87608 [Paraphysoderma sedebokerense]|nr:hypothetical protein BKA69DRAFT_87608 [Paraphysoderma sedebokerense]
MPHRHDDTFTKAWIPPILAYCAASILMTVVNKSVLSGYPFRMTFFVLSVQSVSSVVLLEIFGLLGWVKFKRTDLKGAKQWFSVSFLMALMLFTGAKSLEYLDIPIFTIFKNLTIILIAYGDRFLYGNAVTRAMLVSFMVMVVSSIVAANTDVNFTAVGYAWVILNCLSSAGFVLHMRKVIKRMNFKDFDTVYYNNSLTAPMFLLMAPWMDQWDKFNDARDQEGSVASTFIRATIFSGFAAFYISYASAWCMRVVNSTTYSMVGALNKLPISVAGLVFFNVPATAGNVSSILLGKGHSIFAAHSFQSGLYILYSEILNYKLSFLYCTDNLGFIAGILYTKAKIDHDRSKQLQGSSSIPFHRVKTQDNESSRNASPTRTNEIGKDEVLLTMEKGRQNE